MQICSSSHNPQISSTFLCQLESFLTNLKTVLFTLFSKNPTLTQTTYPTTGQYLTYRTYLNTQNDLLKPDSLTISLETFSWTPIQSAYTKFNSTETTLLAVHDHIIIAMSQQQVTGLCLLDLSAAFDTIDHSIFLHRLKSWFGFHWCCLILDSVLPFISFLHCWYQWHQIPFL